MTSLSESSSRIRRLNDAVRRGEPGAEGRWLFTSGVSGRGPGFIALAVQAIQAFDEFTSDNDPYGEHDFGSLTVAGDRLFWKIDYYDTDLVYGSEDPADPTETSRVLTIMLAKEY